jgi:hypothetical protein
MKSTLGIICLLLIYTLAPAQSAKDIKKNKVKSVTIWQSAKEGDPNTQVKESYEVFDKNGNTTLRIEYKPDGSVDKKETFRYDKNQNKVEEFEYEGDNIVRTHKMYLYDKFRNKAEEQEYSPTSELIKKTIFSYNTGGDKLTETVTDAKGGTLKKTEYKYNTHTLKVQKIVTNKAKQLESVRKWGYEYY